jgi:hypothetical protein
VVEAAEAAEAAQESLATLVQAGPLVIVVPLVIAVYKVQQEVVEHRVMRVMQHHLLV